MKKNLLSLSIGAAIAGLTLAGAANAAVSIAGTGAGNNLTATTATGLALAPGGIGHIGIIPYFSTQNGNQTLFSITNTDTTNGKAVKIRFRSAANSDDVFDFTLFLSPGDVWTANISRDAATGISRLITTDNSCTLPALSDVNRGFVVARLPAVSSTFTAETQASWTREGYIEVLNMADVPPVFANGQSLATYQTTATTTNGLYSTTKHNGSGVAACDSAVLSKLLTTSTSAATLSGLGLDTPSGGLYTNAFIINTANAFLSWSTEATAVVTTGGDRGKLVFAPQLATFYTGGDLAALSADPLFTTTPAGLATTTPSAAVLPSSEFDFPDLSTSYTGTGDGAASTVSAAAQAGTLSTSLAVTSIKNDYSTLAAIGSKTDFTFSLPTRRYAVAVDYSTLSNTPSVATLRFNAGNNAQFAAGNTTLQGLLACVSAGANAVTGYSRSEQVVAGQGAVISPTPVAAQLRFCGEVSVLTVNNDGTSPAGKGVLGASVAVQNLFTSFQEGWININTPGVTAGNGLPVLGSAYTSAIGNPVGGVSTNFAWTYAHKFTR